jgi:uncharacterized protein YqeY
MPLLDRIQSDLMAAMKAKDQARLSAIRMIKTALKKHEVDSVKPLDEQTELKVLGTLVKQRVEAIDMFRKGGRGDLAEKEAAELKVVESYMPAEASEADLEAAIAAALAETGATSVKQLGAVMKASQAKLTGKRVDGRILSEKSSVSPDRMRTAPRNRFPLSVLKGGIIFRVVSGATPTRRRWPLKTQCTTWPGSHHAAPADPPPV